MKKNIGSQLALYPMPVTVIGAMNGAVPTWTLVAHVGILGHDRVLVSLAEPHYINGIIKQERKLSINIVDEGILPELFEFPTYEYLKTGDVLGKCLSFKKDGGEV